VGEGGGFVVVGVLSLTHLSFAHLHPGDLHSSSVVLVVHEGSAIIYIYI